uniref:Uncharacterized protein n=1 Tax=Salix viminalis TaxID=40686 RepID=A0A6N2KRH5_SALVM
MDEATAKGTRPSKARVCIEFDCLVEPPTEIWVQVRSRESGKNLSDSSNNNLQPATEGGKKNKEEWVEVRHKKAAHKHDREDVCDTPLGNLIEEESRKLDKDDPIQPQDREIDKETPSGSLSEIKTPVNLTASDNLKEANLSSKISTDSMVGDSQPIGLCGLNTNDIHPFKLQYYRFYKES